MGRAFTEKDRATIRARLLDSAAELFGRYGLKKTAVDDIVKAAGVAKGTFYQFFPSKEALYFEILDALEDEIQQPMLARLNKIKPLTRKAFTRFLLDSVQAIANAPLLRQMMAGNDMDQLWRRLTPEQMETLSSKDEAVMRPLIIRWQAAGEMIPEDPAVIVQTIRCFFMLTLHEREIGADHFNATLKLMAEAIANRVVTHDQS